MKRIHIEFEHENGKFLTDATVNRPRKRQREEDVILCVVHDGFLHPGRSLGEHRHEVKPGWKINQPFGGYPTYIVYKVERKTDTFMNVFATRAVSREQAFEDRHDWWNPVVTSWEKNNTKPTKSWVSITQKARDKYACEYYDIPNGPNSWEPWYYGVI